MATNNSCGFPSLFYMARRSRCNTMKDKGPKHRSPNRNTRFHTTRNWLPFRRNPNQGSLSIITVSGSICRISTVDNDYRRHGCYGRSSSMYRVSMGISRNGVFKMFPSRLGACPTTSYIDPFGQARALFAFDILDISVAAAAAANAVFLLFVPVFPVVILFDTILLISCCQFEVGLTR